MGEQILKNTQKDSDMRFPATWGKVKHELFSR